MFHFVGPVARGGFKLYAGSSTDRVNFRNTSILPTICLLKSSKSSAGTQYSVCSQPPTVLTGNCLR